MVRCQKLPRRAFLKGALAASAVLAGSAAMAGCQPKTAGSNGVLAATGGSGDIEWDDEADLVVIGGGTAVFGGIEALHNGKSVIVIEPAVKPPLT